MGQRAQKIADTFEQANNELIAAAERCSDAQWKTATAAEQWPVGVVFHHVAEGHKAIAGLAQLLATGQPLPPVTFDMIHQGNAEHAKKHANCTKAETVKLLREGGAAAAGIVRGLGDEQLDKSGTLVADLPPMSAQQFLESILIAHIGEHLGNIRTSVGA